LSHAKTAKKCRLVQVKSNLGAGAPEFVPLAQQLQELGRTGPEGGPLELGRMKNPQFLDETKIGLSDFHHSLSCFF
jgi:hypothetical protein